MREIGWGEERNAKYESERIGWRELPLVRQFGLLMCAAVVLPAALWLFRGERAVLEMKYQLIIFDLGLILILAVVDIWKIRTGRAPGNHTGGGTEKDGSEEEDSPWRILYEDDEEEEMSYPVEAAADERQDHPKDGIGECFQTALLSDASSEMGEFHRLIPLSGSGEEIIISYYPFVIGKHKDLADYVLPRDTISRFHLRLDEEEGHYTVTDLNSTNGTRVGGRLLEANETVRLEPGDQVYIADQGYAFY